MALRQLQKTHIVGLRAGLWQVRRCTVEFQQLLFFFWWWNVKCQTVWHQLILLINFCPWFVKIVMKEFVCRTVKMPIKIQIGWLPVVFRSLLQENFFVDQGQMEMLTHFTHVDERGLLRHLWCMDHSEPHPQCSSPKNFSHFNRAFSKLVQVETNYLFLSVVVLGHKTEMTRWAKNMMKQLFLSSTTV